MASPFVSMLAAGAHVRVHPFGLVFLFVFAAVSFALYFLPSIIAISRHHPQATLVVILDFVLGWTVVGWVAILAWSLVGTPVDR